MSDGRRSQSATRNSALAAVPETAAINPAISGPQAADTSPDLTCASFKTLDRGCHAIQGLCRCPAREDASKEPNKEPTQANSE